MADLGRVQPMYGKWRWPFHVMQEGDEFYVSATDRHPEEVRKFASVRAAQLGIKIETHKAKDDSAMHIKRVPYDADNLSTLPKAFDYGQVRLFFREEYGIDADSFPWWQAPEAGKSYCVEEVKRTGSDPRQLIEASVGKERYAVELGDKTITISCLGKGDTLEGWKKVKLDAMME